MPTITSQQVGVALDMFGCPNRCRHCYLGVPHGPNPHLTEDDLRWVVQRFREVRRGGEDAPAFRQLRVSTWLREPDFSDNYRRLYDLENELSDLPSLRADFELLSVWRLARDPDYAEWAHSIGVRVCQISFFGLERVTDWAYRRRGAFQDALIATERLLAAGIRPRWQWFFTKRIIPDLPGLIELTRELPLRERCEALGGPFTLFMHCPAPDGEAWGLEHLRPTAADVQRVSDCLREKGELEILRPLGEPERKLVHLLHSERQPAASSASELSPRGPWFFVRSNFDVYPNFAYCLPAWRLGNLQRDGAAAILDALENDRVPGLHATFRVPVSELARRFGRPYGRRLYAVEDIKSRWVRMYINRLNRCAAGSEIRRRQASNN